MDLTQQQFEARAQIMEDNILKDIIDNILTWNYDGVPSKLHKEFYSYYQNHKGLTKKQFYKWWLLHSQKWALIFILDLEEYMKEFLPDITRLTEKQFQETWNK